VKLITKDYFDTLDKKADFLLVEDNIN